MSKIEGTKLIGMITPNGDNDNTFPTHEDIYGKGGYMVVDNHTEISTERVKKGMLVYDNSDDKIYKCTDAAKSNQVGGWEELKTTYDGGGKYLGTVSKSSDILKLTIADAANIKAGDFYRVSNNFTFIDGEPAHTGDLIMATSDGGGGWDLLHTDQETLVSITSSGTGYVTNISNTGNALTVTKGTNIKVSNATNADTASVANKLVGSVEEIRANAKFSESSIANDAYDTTLLDPGKIQLLHNYTAYSNWLYAPSTMGYGHVLNIGCGTGWATAQFAWDTTPTPGKTGNLYWRFGDPNATSDGDNRAAYLKDSSINCNWKQVVTSDMLRSNIFQSFSTYTGTKTGSCFRADYNNYTATRTSENGYTKFSNIKLDPNSSDQNRTEFAIYTSCKSSVLHDGTSPITVSFVVKCNKSFSPNDTTTKKARFYCSQASGFQKLVEIKANTDTRITATFRFLQVPTSGYFYLAFYIPDVSSDTVLYIKELMVQIGSTATPWTPALEDYLDLSTMNAKVATYANTIQETSNHDLNSLDPGKFVISHNYNSGYTPWYNAPAKFSYGQVLQLPCSTNGTIVTQLAFDIPAESGAKGTTRNFWVRTGNPSFYKNNSTDTTITTQDASWKLSKWKRVAWADELDKWVILGDFTLDYREISNPFYVDEFIKIPVTAGKYTLTWDDFEGSISAAQVGGVVMEKGYNVPEPSMQIDGSSVIDTSHVIDVVDPESDFTINGNYDLYIMPVSGITNWNGNVIPQNANKFSISGLKIKKIGSNSLDFIESNLLKVDSYSEANSNQYPSLACLEDRLSSYKAGTLDKAYLPLTGGTLKGMLTIYNGNSSGNNFCVGNSSTSVNRNGVIIKGDSSELYAVKKGASTELKIQSNGGNTAFGGTISTAGNITVSNGGVFESSDIRKKNIISELPLEKCYDLLTSCQEIIFTFKSSDKEQIGVIAQEVEKFFPEIIHIGGDGYKAVDYSKLSVICLRILKDLITRLNKLENEREVK